MKKEHSFGQLASAFLAVYIIWGSTYLAIRFAIETIPPFLMAGVRFLIAGSILYIFVSIRGAEKPKSIHWRSAAIVGGLLLLGGNGGVVWAEQYVPSGLTALLISTVPIWVVIISWIIPKGENPTIKTVIGVILGFLGLFFLISPESIISGTSINTAGAVVLMLATLSWSAGSVYSRFAEFPKSKLLTVSMEMIAGGVLLVIVGSLMGDWGKVNLSGISNKSFYSLLYLIFFGSIIAFTAYIWLLDAAGPTRATTYAYVNPVVAVFLGWALAGESLNIKIFISAIIIISAVAIIITDFSKINFERIKRLYKTEVNS